MLQEKLRTIPDLSLAELAIRQISISQLSTMQLPSHKHPIWKFSKFPEDLITEKCNYNFKAETNYRDALLPLSDCFTILVLNGKLLTISDDININVHSKPVEKISATNEFLVLLNDSLCPEQIEITINQNIGKPIYLVNMFNGKSIHPKISIEVNCSESVNLIEHHLALNSNKLFTNCVTQVNCSANSKLTHYLVQHGNDGSTQISSCYANIHNSADYQLISLSLGNKLAKLYTQANLIEENANFGFSSLQNTFDKQTSDIYLDICHHAKHTTSNSISRGMANDESISSIVGRILVAKNATDCNADLDIKNILLSNTASANACPELEIYCDAVKCSHGATTGKLNPEAMFYLRSRGIDMQQAKWMLINSFIRPVIEKIAIAELYDYVAKQMEINWHG